MSNPTPDTLEVELILADEKFDTKITGNKQKLEDYGRAADKVSKTQLVSNKSIESFNLAEAKAEKLRRTLETVSRVQGGKGFDYLSASADKAAAKVGTIQKQLAEVRKLMSQATNKSVIDQLKNEASGLEKELDRIKQKTDRLNNRPTNVNQPSRAANFADGAAGALGIPISAAAVGAFAVGAGAIFGKESLAATKEAANSQLQLQSVAKETGLSYQKLTEQARAFGEVNLLSNREAQSTFAQIVNFANAAGRADKIEEFRKRFSDLAAAKGINASQLGDISGQLNALTDEATDKLLNANPSAFYDKFAKSIGTTADKLTDAQKRAAVFDEVLKKGAIFEGSAVKRFNDASSEVDKLAQKYENLKEKAGQALLPVVDFASKSVDFLKENKTSNPVALAVGKETSGLRNLLPGAIPARFVVNAVDKLSRGIADIITGNDLDFQTKITVDFNIQNQKVKEAVDYLRKTEADIKNAKSNPFGSIENFALSKISDSQIAGSFIDPVKRKELLENANADARKFVEDLAKSFERAGSDLGGNPGLLKFAQRDFQKYANLFDQETRFKIQNSFTNAISDGAAKGFQNLLQNSKASLDELRKGLRDVNSSLDLKPDAKSSLIREFTQKIEQDVEKAKEKVKELQRVYLETFNNLSTKLNSSNPFVSIFTDADKALKDLKVNIKGLPPELQKIAVEMQKKINFRQLLEAQTGNQLSVFDLREQANNFRNPFDGEKQRKDQQEFVERFLRNNPNYLYSQGKSALDEETRSRILKQFAPSQLFETPADRLNKSLEEKFNLLYKPGQTSEQQRISDRQFIAATQGVNSLDLNRNLRESAAFVREREAARQEKYQTDALDLYKKQLAVQEKIEANTKANNKLAESGGTKAIDLKIKDERAGGSVELQKSATAADTAAGYQDPDSFYTNGSPCKLIGGTNR